MDVLVVRCAGLDVHRDSVMATVRLPAKRRQREHRRVAFRPRSARSVPAAGVGARARSPGRDDRPKLARTREELREPKLGVRAAS